MYRTKKSFGFIPSFLGVTLTKLDYKGVSVDTKDHEFESILFCKALCLSTCLSTRPGLPLTRLEKVCGKGESRGKSLKTTKAPPFRIRFKRMPEAGAL